MVGRLPLLALLLERAVVEGAAVVLACFPAPPLEPESLQNPPMLPNMSLANEESAPPPLPVLEATSVLVLVAGGPPRPLPPLRNELKAESPRRESPSREVVVVVVDEGGGLFAVEVGRVLLRPEGCPAATEVGCPSNDCPEVEPTEFGCTELLVEEPCPDESRGGVLILVEVCGALCPVT